MTTSDAPRVEAGDVAVLLDRWVRQGLISPHQAARIAAAERHGAASLPAQRGSGGAPPPRAGLAAEALGYLGAALALAATLLLTGMFWSDLGAAVRLTLTASATILLLAAGGLVGGAEGSEGRLRAAMWLLGSAAWAGFLGVLGHDAFGLDGADTWLLVGLGSTALTALLYAGFRTALQQLAVFVALLITAGALGGRAGWDEPTLVGLAGWAVATAWFALGEAGRLPPPTAARYIGAVGAVVAAEATAGAVLGHLLVLVTLAALFTVGVRTDSLGLLAVAAVGTLAAVPSAVGFYLGDQVRVAAPVALLLVGGVLVGVAVHAVRRRNGPISPSRSDHAGSVDQH